MVRVASAFALVVVLSVLGVSVAAARPADATRAAGPTFSGNGGKSLPPFRVSAPSTLRWTNNGSIFQLFPKGLGDGSVNAASRGGTTYLEPGTYRLDVNAIGSWTIRVAPGIERPRSLGNGLVGFRGNGGRTLPPFNTRRGTNLVWTNSGAIFQMFPEGFTDVSVNSQGKRGTSYMDAGRHQLTVNAIGEWMVGWKP